MFKKIVVFILCVSVTFLSACQSPLYNQTEANIADVKIKSQDERQKFDRSLKPKPALVVKNGPYVDLTPISIEKNPAWLKNKIVIRGDQLPFSYYSRTIAAGAGPHILVRYQNELDPAMGVSMNYSGTVKGALDLLATKTGYVYNVRHKQVYWQSLVSKTFDIAFFPGSTNYTMGKTSTGGSQGGGAQSGSAGKPAVVDYSDSEYSNLSAALSVWKDLETSVKSMLSKDGSVVVSESTASVTVRDRPTNIQNVEQYIRSLNKNLSKQILIKIQILEVNLEDDFNFGIDWQLVSKFLAHDSSTIQFTSNEGNVIPNVATLSGKPFPIFGIQGGSSNNNKALITALNQQGKTSVVSEPRVMATNNQVSAIRIVTQQAYVASVENTSQSGGGAGSNSVSSTVTPGSVTFGITLYILPKILGDKIYLQLNADLSTLDDLGTFSTNPSSNAAGTVPNQPNNVTIQLPTISQKHFNQRAMIHSGDTLILSGLRKLNNQVNAMQFLKSQTLGGKGAVAKNTETVILVTPAVMDEKP